MKTASFTEGLRPLPSWHYINGVRIAPDGAEMVPTFDPATGAVLCELPKGTLAEVNAAVEAAKRSLMGDWQSCTPAQRGRILIRIAQLIRRDATMLARIETLDSGKPLRESLGDVETAAAYFEYYAGIADKLQGDTIPLGPDYISFTLHEPVGVTAHIIPWNFPLVTTARGVAPALAAGNTVVVKPSMRRRSRRLFSARFSPKPMYPPAFTTCSSALGMRLVTR